jgi:hypothetical protein
MRQIGLLERRMPYGARRCVIGVPRRAKFEPSLRIKTSSLTATGWE